MATTTLVQMANCPQCGAELGSGDPAGLCPQCLIQGAFDSSVGGDESRTQTVQTASAGDDDFGRYQILRRLGEKGPPAVCKRGDLHACPCRSHLLNGPGLRERLECGRATGIRRPLNRRGVTEDRILPVTCDIDSVGQVVFFESRRVLTVGPGYRHAARNRRWENPHQARTPFAPPSASLRTCASTTKSAHF